MTTSNPVSLGSLSGAIALIQDRTALTQEPIASGWLIANNKLATIANVFTPFTNDLYALKITFPKSNKVFGVKSIQFHPRFDKKLARQTRERGTLVDSPEQALQKFNCAILTLTEELAEITPANIESVSQAIRFPLSATGDGLAGSLSEIELPIVIQTINNAKKQGILYICDELQRPVAQIFCKSGRVSAAKFKSLFNETAIYQMFAKGIGGRFIFQNCGQPDWVSMQSITQHADGLLIEAHRRLDELVKFKQEILGQGAYFVRAQKELNSSGFEDSELKIQANILWQVLDGTTRAEDLWLLVETDDYNVFKALYQLFKLGQVVRVQDSSTRVMDVSQSEIALPKVSQISQTRLPQIKLNLTKSSQTKMAAAESTDNSTDDLQSLTLGWHLPLTPFEEITSVSMNGATNRTQIKLGTLLGAIDPYDTWHLLHDIPLSPQGSGSPLFKNGAVIGMHCGVIPSSPELKNKTVIYQQMLWVDALMECLKATGDHDAVKEVEIGRIALFKDDRKVLGSSRVENKLPSSLDTAGGCTEIASIKCPRCGENTFDSARSCSNCQLNIIHSTSVTSHLFDFKTLISIVAVLVLGATVAAGVAWSRLPSPNFQSAPFAILPETPWIKLDILYADPKTNTWIAESASSIFKNGDIIHFKLDALRSSYVYLLYKGSTSAKASLIYPPPASSNMLGEGESTTYPAQTETVVGNKRTLVGSQFDEHSGVERIVAIASDRPLEWLNDTNNMDAAFTASYKLLADSHNRDGVQLNENDLRQIMSNESPILSGLNSKQTQGNLADGEGKTSVFITAVAAKHVGDAEPAARAPEESQPPQKQESTPVQASPTVAPATQKSE